MENVEISIVIPVYNMEQHLKRCLNSILVQTYKNYEVICVNDCSTDSSLEILEKYEEKYPEIFKVISNPVNVGLGATRDNGTRCAEGKYIVYIDSDDCIKKDYLETYHNKIIEDDYDCVLGGYILVRGDKKKVYNKKLEPVMNWLWPTAWARMYKREFLQKNNLDFRGTRLYEDEPFTYRVMCKKPKVAELSYCGYYYIMNEKSLTQQKSSTSRAASFDTYMGVIEEVVKELKQQNLDKESYEILEFGVAAGLIANALYNGKSSGRYTMKKIRNKCFTFLDKYFPDYMKNPYFHMMKIPKLETKKRFFTWLIILFRHVRLEKYLFMLAGEI